MFSSRATARIVLELLRADDGMRLTDIAGATELPLSSAQRAVDALIREGVVAREPGRRPRYHVTIDAPRDALAKLARWQLKRMASLAPDGQRRPRRARPSRAAAAVLPGVADRLAKRFDPIRIVLFGSQARGDAAEVSDVDLLVVMPDGTPSGQAEREMYGELADLPIAKDIVVTTPSQIEAYGQLIGTVLRDALRDGVTLYER